MVLDRISALALRFVVGAAVAHVALAASVAILRAQSETLVQVPSGTYSLEQVVTQSGTAISWIRYRPAVPGTVTIRGGEVLEGRQYVILDGFTIDTRLDPNYPSWSPTLNITSSEHIVITNSELVGPADIHTGFDITGAQNCKEAEGFPTPRGPGFRTGPDTDYITFSNVLVHGFHTAGRFHGKHDKVVNSLFRNNHNAFDVEGGVVEIVDSVFWVHPNHLFELHGATTVYLVNNLFVDAQDMFASQMHEGVDEVHMVHNTFWIPANKPCYGFTGINLAGVHQLAEVRNNLLVNKQTDIFFHVTDAVIPLLESDYNLFYYYGAQTTEEFKLLDQGRMVPLETWRSISGQDPDSIGRQQPLFVDPPQYEDFSMNQWGFRIPSSVAQARAWLTLRAGSPGAGAGSDGLDMGITGSGGPIPPGAPTNLRIIR